jgi:hypothetical protein
MDALAGVGPERPEAGPEPIPAWRGNPIAARSEADRRLPEAPGPRPNHDRDRFAISIW